MTTLRFALAQHDFPVGAVADNAARVRRWSTEAATLGAALVAFPELTLSGYPPDDLLLRPSFINACEDALQALASASADQALVLGLPQAEGDGELCNAAALLRGGRVMQRVRKQVLPNYAVFDEKRYFQRGDSTCVVDIDGVRTAILVCEDIWSDAPVAAAAHAGAQWILVINASPWDQGKQERREALLSRHARSSGCAIAYVNLVGGQDDVLFDGSSMLVNPDGRVVARAPAFTDALLLCEFDTATRTLRADGWPPLCDAPPEAVLYAGLARGIRDYVGKNGFTDVLLGLSGGIDSALTLALAVDALGAERVTAVMLPSRYTSRLSLDGARAQAQTLGVDYRVLSIEDSFAAMLTTLQPAFAGRPPDITEENLQARIRGALLMALSNKHGKLLLATGNKSEMAVGYSTLYGDMCGGYAPLKDVYKTMVYRLARWRNGASGPGTRDPGPVISHSRARADAPAPFEIASDHDPAVSQTPGPGSRVPSSGTSHNLAGADALAPFGGASDQDPAVSQTSGPGSRVPGPGISHNLAGADALAPFEIASDHDPAVSQTPGPGSRVPGPGISHNLAGADALVPFEIASDHDPVVSQTSGPGSRVPGPVVPTPVIPVEVIERPPSAELRADQTDQDSLPPYAELDAILERFVEDEQSQAEIIAAGHDGETVHRITRLVLANEFKRRQAAPGPKVSRRAFGRERRYPISSGWR